MIPIKPFDTYKWRWLHTQPTEGLLKPAIFLGVLRVADLCEGLSKSDEAVYNALQLVQKETAHLAEKGRPITLARDTERNILRNSGQYWQGTGLLKPTHGKIELTAFGHQVAKGKVTQGEFAAIMVQQAILPNLQTYKPEEVKKWNDAGLEIKPLLIIMEVLEGLGEVAGVQNAYLTPNELIKVVIPLVGNKTATKDIAAILYDVRLGKTSTVGWPDCAPEANDKRFAKEFLLFLSNYGLCRYKKGKNEYESRYHLDELFDVDAVSTLTAESIFSGDKEAESVITAVRSSGLPSIIERQRTVVTVLSRPGQPKFRKKILKIGGGCCLLTGERIAEVLEAAHIIPVNSGGTDEADNGICLRVDIHRLFDSGNIRLRPSGELQFSDAVKDSGNYAGLPSKIAIPAFVKMANVEWRDKYC